MNINILTPGGNVSYNIPVLKVRQYSASELFVKHLAAKYKKIEKGVNLNMGGKVLNYRAKDILNRRHAEGFIEGEASGHAEGFIEGEEQTKIQIATKLLTCGNDIKSVADITELPEETVSKLAEKI